MSITKNNPNKALLAGECIIVNEFAAGVAIKPEMLIEGYSNSGVFAFRPNASASELAAHCVALEQGEMNKGIDDLYSVGDLVKAGYLCCGAVIYGIIPSGQNIAIGGLLQSNGDGKLKAATATTQDAGLGEWQALEASGAVTVDTRIRVQLIR